ncbi:ankyrin repeat domain-containing protein 39 [Eublepharis macularius]|uniref:Ankyrin repeat domain-containing protein 39 n=1 Tax=Eublepharis macularius TaxID=481883 RepID=A0AA97KAM5_EUBMA|nr:ankyrin repeat domain-containing protein 39 [Eublepharis macularius]XP_054854620.1 ankyrin repeat domain-containing protein 39 [Eublepharis macularius]XP_054854621.1 ankyrin repeat domain-containing protein 39 [Eublepharis macularius]
MMMTSLSGHRKDGSCCSNRSAVLSVHQSVQEMDFERGIWYAALNGDLSGVKKHVLQHGKVNESDPLGYTALHYASRNGHYDVCQFLLENKAIPDAQTHGGATPLHRASYCGHINIVKLLLDQGADPFIRDDDGMTCLHKAAENGHQALCILLLEHNSALRHIRDKKLSRPCDLVPDDQEELRKLLDKSELPASDSRESKELGSPTVL